MTVHVGEITSEVVAMGGAAGSEAGGEASVWEQQCRTEATIERLARDRLRTATGYGHD
ncbi:MAG: hypothetical protein ACRDRR_00405 [Pseudonocardiaceae bacterium]